MIYTFTNWQCIGFFVLGVALGASALASLALTAAKHKIPHKEILMDLMFWLACIAALSLGIYMHNPIVGGG